jgi:adenosylcobinamide-GDP ribazoletransferase
MQGFAIALQFLTRITVNPDVEITEEKLGKSVIYFPVVGLVLGCILVIINTFMSNFFFLLLQ